MPEVTQILLRIEAGDAGAAEELLPMLYDELRRLAAHRLAEEKPGQTLQATALVHEAYIRLLGGPSNQHLNSRGIFSPQPQKPCAGSSSNKRAAKNECGMVADCGALILTARFQVPTTQTRTC